MEGDQLPKSSVNVDDWNWIIENEEKDTMDVDSPDCVTQYLDLKEETLERFCKDAARAFFSEFGLINHQINSFNQFITSGLQEIFDSLGEVVVEPGYDPSKGGGGDWQHATITYGKVRLGKPTFWTERSGQETEELKLLPKHARLQNMTYSSKLKVEVRVQVYILEKSDKAKTGKDSHICKRVLSDDKKEITIGSMPVMVKSKLCWLDTLDKSDCLYDSGGYFIVKGAEKVFIAQEQRCLTRLWITDKPVWTASHISEMKKKRVYVKLVDASKVDGLNSGKLISIYFLYATMPMMSSLRKTRQQVAYAGKAGDARYPNPSYWGKLCFLSTPDGENCGLVKNLSVTALVSSSINEPVLDKLVSCGMEKLDQISVSSLSKTYKIFLNGDWIGVCSDSRLFVLNFRQMRRAQEINSQVEIKLDQHQKEVRIFSDAGRLLRPLLIVENLKKVKSLKGGISSYQSLVNEGIIELIGVEEEEDCRAAWGIRYLLQEGSKQAAIPYTHCELDPSFLLGLSCGIIPFANHNLARRVLFQAQKHSHQAVGFSTTNPDIRVDTLMHQMYYPQRPLFRTVVADCLGRRDYSLGLKDGMSRPELFNGQNAIVAVNVHLGYNQEDSLVMNRASLERGMFRTEHFRSYKAEVENKEITKRIKLKDKVEFGKMQSKKGRVDSLEDDGFPWIGACLQTGDIVIGKVAESGEDHSTKLKHTEKGMVQKVVLSANDEGKNFAVVTLRQVRSPCLGDKFSSMHGQKGVVGFLESQENFPFTREGIVPDIVINPHAFPTRQTPGQLLEASLGKGIALGGKITYATPFTTPSVDVIAEQLHRLNFQRWGAERVLNGRTGELMQTMIFTGPTFYQRLIHMSEDKVKFRNTGPVHPLTRQPVADRKRFGGVKFGEMERDCLLAHGAAANLHERLFTLSDFSQMHVCRTCSRFANVIQRVVSNGKIRGPYCGFCKSGENVVRINVPYGAKLLFQELFSMGICLKFETEVC
ncbi:uncharacterized protein A4U43_C03F1170 [Asparagus officinalis]|uniref:DNA-directed RNA polymerase subunit beta n=1 Tax=Asparagus officinalis TaxID=4686 RepID=A0A5P1F6Y8_ASPOF|nr:uncharacterized protein A4U43_C03F1170 [Asparagus officinalis]